jgi:hypothetical protein
VIYTDLRTNSEYLLTYHLLIGFDNQDGLCLLHGTDWIFNSFFQNNKLNLSLYSFKLKIVDDVLL